MSSARQQAACCRCRTARVTPRASGGVAASVGRRYGGLVMRRSRARHSMSDYGLRPALAEITGGRRWWIVSTISRVSIPCR
jgi:hypothetical protein